MMYPFMTLADGTEIVHSDPFFKDGKEKVRVYLEKPVFGGFHSAECLLPDFEWQSCHGFSENDLSGYLNFLKSVSHVVISPAREGGFDNAANL